MRKKNPEELSADRQLRRDRLSAERAGRRRNEAAALDFAWARRARAPDRVRESDDHVAGARERARKRDGDSCRCRRESFSFAAARFGRERCCSPSAAALRVFCSRVWGIGLVKTIGAQTIPRLSEVSLDLVVLAVTLAVAVGTGIIFGIVPALPAANLI